MSRTHAVQGSASAVGATRGPDAYPSKGAANPKAPRRSRGRKRNGDPISFAAGIVTGAGLCLIWINLYVEMWPR